MKRLFGYFALLAMLPYLLLGQAAFGAGYVLTNGPVWGADGTVAAPQFTFAGDDNTGMYRIGADNIGIGVNGAKVLDIGTAGLGVTGTLMASGLATFSAGATATAGSSGAEVKLRYNASNPSVSLTYDTGGGQQGIGWNITNSGGNALFEIGTGTATAYAIVQAGPTTGDLHFLAAKTGTAGGTAFDLGATTALVMSLNADAITLSKATQLGANAGGFLHRIIGKDAAGDLGKYGLQISATYAGTQTLQVGTDQTNSYSWLRVPSGSLKIYDGSAEVADFDALAITLSKPVNFANALWLEGFTTFTSSSLYTSYIGGKEGGFVADAADNVGTNVLKGLYYDGTWKRSYLNRTGVSVYAVSVTATTDKVWGILSDSSISHAAGDTANLTNEVMSVTAAGAVTTGPSTATGTTLINQGYAQLGAAVTGTGGTTPAIAQQINSGTWAANTSLTSFNHGLSDLDRILSINCRLEDSLAAFGSTVPGPWAAGSKLVAVRWTDTIVTMYSLDEAFAAANLSTSSNAYTCLINFVETGT